MCARSRTHWPSSSERSRTDVEVRWKLRMAAAQREIWTGAQLRRLLAERAGVEMSAASVSALMRQAPKQLKLSTLQALCVALDCQPWRADRGRHHPDRQARPRRQASPAARARAVRRVRARRHRSDPMDGVCADCGHDGKLHARDRCQPCYWRAKHDSAKETCPGCGERWRLRPTAEGPRCHRCIRRARPRKQPTPRRCRRCGQVRRHVAHGLCTACYQRDPLIVGVWVQGAQDRLAERCPDMVRRVRRLAARALRASGLPAAPAPCGAGAARRYRAALSADRRGLGRRPFRAQPG